MTARGLKSVVFLNIKPMPIPSNIRASHRYEAFKSYAHVIGAALASFPTVVVVDPEELSIETYSARCRDAITAKQLYQWQSPFIDEASFAKHGNALVVSMQEDKVIIGSKDAVRARRKATLQSAIKGKVLTVTSKTEVEVLNSPVNLQLLCQLLSVRAFNPCPSFFVMNADLQALKALESRFDVAFEQDPTDLSKHYII